MTKLYLCIVLATIISVATGVNTHLGAQSFSQSSLDLNNKGVIYNGTNLMFGPDGRLYVAEYTGEIKIFTIERTGPGNYVVQEMEVISGIHNIPDHNDDGTPYESIFRETIGIAVGGTAANPVVYVSSSDFRIGGGGGSSDVNLDTNSGIITRFTWNGTSWDEVDIVRGLPRSEENHATNEMELATINGSEYLIVAQGGHTNGGGPSKNFAYTTEYALSAAILSINLSMINAMPVKDHNGRKYIYDLPTLDDPTRRNVNGIINPDTPGYTGEDVNDPFGGNDGLNQAIIVPGGPVQIFSPGYRNAFGVVVTESGAVYVSDNGANGGWGGFPVNEGSGMVNNDYDPEEPGSSSPSGGEQINNLDHLSLITRDINNYTFGSFYGGHPAPVRANPFGAGLYTNPSATGRVGAVFRTRKYHPVKSDDDFTTDPNLGLPANWPPVQQTNLVEGDWRGPGIDNPDGPEDVLVTGWGTNTNGMDEYTASNFNNAMKGNIIAGVNTGILRRVELNEDGSLKKLTASFASGLGGDALGITCNGDNEIFPGTIWVVTLNGSLVILEPQDFGVCYKPGDTGYDLMADNDLDGYTNQDEIDNGTDICNGASQPRDFDKSAGGNLVSDLNDEDDDQDGVADSEDPFQMGDQDRSGSDAFPIPVTNELFSSNAELKGYLGLGLTGIMNNGDPNPNWLDWIDRRDDPQDPNPNDILGGAIGAMTMHMTAGTALGKTNTQEKGFQYGVQVNSASGNFTAVGSLTNFNNPLQLYGNSAAPNAELGMFIGDGTQSNYIKFVLTPSGIMAQQEIADVPSAPLTIEFSPEERPHAKVTFYYKIDPTLGEIQLNYSIDAGERITLGTMTAQGTILEAIQNEALDLAVGMIGTSNAAGVEVEGTWDYLNVVTDEPAVSLKLPDLEKIIGAESESIYLANHFYDEQGVEGLVFTVEEITNAALNAVISGHTLDLDFPSVPAQGEITIRATDADQNFVEQTFRVSVIEAKAISVLYRINSGGPAIAALDGGPDWEGDTTSQPSEFLSEDGNNKAGSYSMDEYTADVDLSTTPVSIFDTERYDGKKGAPNLTYSFPIEEPGSYEVRLYMGNGYHGTTNAGDRIFDVSIEGIVTPELDDIDLSGTYGHLTGAVVTYTAEVTDGMLDIVFLHEVENPLINGIEILGSSGSVENPISIAEIEDQGNTIGDDLDGSLVVSASGGDGNLIYAISGAPSGVVIEPTNGQIGGSIDPGAAENSPYTVVVTVDDGDEHSTDAITTSFNWVISAGEPVVVEDIPDLIRSAGAPGENIDLVIYFSDDQGAENLVFSLEQNSNPAVESTISGNILSLGFPLTSAVADIVIRATDSNQNFVEEGFRIIVSDSTGSGVPTIVQTMADITRTVGSANENFELGDYFSDDQGVEGLLFTVEENSNPIIGALISGSLLGLTYPSTAAETSLTIRATDATGNFVEQSFGVIVKEATETVVLYRVNAGGPAIAAIDGKINWDADTRALPSAYLSEDGNNKTGSYSIVNFTAEVDLTTTPASIYNTERYDGKAGAPNLTYSFPVTEPGQYEVRLFMGNGYHGTSAAGQRVFDVAIEGTVSAAMDNIDLSGSYGHLKGTVITYRTEVTDGLLDISFIHVVENPLINGIEILSSSGTTSSIHLAEMADQNNLEGDTLDGSLMAAASGGDGALNYSMAGAPSGVVINRTSGVISGIIDANSSLGSPYTVVITVDDSDLETEDAVSRSFIWTVTKGEEVALWTEKEESENYTARHECSFVQAGNEFFLMGGRESAKTLDVYDYATNSWTALADSAPFEFNHFQATEYAGLIWVIGAFKDNAYPEETPAEYIWAFDPAAREWIQGPAIPADRRRGAAGLVVYEDEFYIVGGNIQGHDGGYVAWFDKFNPETGTWTNLGNAPRARDHFQAAVIGSKLYLVGGRLSGGSGGVFKPVIPEVDVFDFISGSWRTLPAAQNLPTPRGAPAVINYNNKLLVIGGEVSNELVYGATVSDALKITEEFDPVSGNWSRLPDLNHERHGTQAIVSGGGVFILAGSPNVGGGNQKNMEFFGVDAPAGSPSIASSLEAPQEGVFTEASLVLPVETAGGNVGILIKNIQITGPGAANYEIASGAVTNGFFLPNSLHEISVNKISNTAESATLVITYGNNGELAIPLISNSGITLAPIEDQTNLVGDLVGSGLVALATGGEGDLVYSMNGAPAGVSINPFTGEISGSISTGAEGGSPYAVSVVVDDSDAQTDDAVSTTFTWIISDGNPFVVQTIPNMERTVGAASELFDLAEYFSDDGGAENLVFTIEDNTDFSIGSTISGSMIQLEFPDFPAESVITVRASDDLLNYAEQSFTVTVSGLSVSQEILYRINTGGPQIAAIDGELAWGADTSTQPSPYLTNNGGNRTSGYSINTFTSEVDLSTTPADVFHSERYAAAGTGGLTYSLPVAEPGVYEVRLYLGNGWNGTSSPGTRIFDVSLEGLIYPELDDLDLSASLGHKVGTVISLEVEVTDGSLDIHFIHGVENPLVNAIEILSSDTPASDLNARVETEAKQMEQPLMKDSVVTGEIYPNPASSFAYVEVSEPAIGVNELQIYGYDGRLVKIYEAERVKERDGEFKLNVRDLPDGTYIVRVVSEAAPVFTLRLVVQK